MPANRQAHMQRLLLAVTAVLLIGLLLWRFGWLPFLASKFRAPADDPWAYQTQDDPASKEADSVDLVNGTPFTFTWGDGSGLHGYNVVKVHNDATVEYTFQRTPGQWQQATFSLEPGTFQDLRLMLKDLDYFRLKKSYSVTRVEDGMQRFIKVEVGGARKGVFCNNYFPDEAVQIGRFVENRIIMPHADAISRSKILDGKPRNMEKESFD